MPRTRKPATKVDKKGESNGILTNSLTSTPVPSTDYMLSSKSPSITEQDILSAQNNNDLMKIIHSLTNTKQDEIFAEYKNKTEIQLQENDRLINNLQEELNNQQKIIDKLMAEKSDNILLQTPMKAKSQSQKMYVSPIRRKKTSKQEQEEINQDQLSKELETIGITLDMLELLTGLRIVHYEEDDSKFYFDVKQGSTNGNGSEVTMGYRLIIAKEFTSTAEINYVPTFINSLSDQDSDDDTNRLYEGSINERERNSRMLLDILPEYFCDNLTFPYNTLSQFYTKINRALNKGSKA